MLGAVAVEHVRFVLVAEPPGALQHRVVVDRHPVEAPQLEVEHAREGELAVGEELEVAGAGDEGAALVPPYLPRKLFSRVAFYHKLH